MTSYDPQALLDFYLHHLDDVILPFWLDRSIDAQLGGYFTCFDNTGARLLSEDKFTWSQGRMVWVLSSLGALAQVTPEKRAHYLDLAGAGARFLMAHSLLDNGHCVFLMNRDGSPQEQLPGQGYDTSIYADCFVILGLSRFAATSGDPAALAFSRALYHSVLERLAT